MHLSLVREFCPSRDGRKALTLNAIPQLFTRTNDKWHMRLWHVTLQVPIQLHYSHLTTDPPSTESELWVLCPKEERDAPEPFIVLTNSPRWQVGIQIQSVEGLHPGHPTLFIAIIWRNATKIPTLLPSPIMKSGMPHLPSQGKVKQASKPTLGGGSCLKNEFFYPQLFFFPSIEILMDWAGKWEPEKRAGKFCPLLLLLLQLLSNHSECILSLPGLCLRFLGNSPRAGGLQ